MHVVKPESDLDIVIYAEGKITREDARLLYARKISLPVAVDIRVETLACGFSLIECATAGSERILLRILDGFDLGNDRAMQDRLQIDYSAVEENPVPRSRRNRRGSVFGSALDITGADPEKEGEIKSDQIVRKRAVRLARREEKQRPGTKGGLLRPAKTAVFRG